MKAHEISDLMTAIHDYAIENEIGCPLPNGEPICYELAMELWGKGWRPNPELAYR